jgi:gamma-glutamyl hercynylcysteine S-oxide synthase
MRRRIAMILGLVLLSAVSAMASRAEWKMRVHEGTSVTEFTVSGVDSVTFLDVIPAGMVRVPAGYVRLGQTGIAEPVNDVYVGQFDIDRYEVSNARYKAFIDTGGYTNPAYWNPIGWAWRTATGVTLPEGWNDLDNHGGGTPGNEDFPVGGVSWWEADAYCRWAGGRLPTEAEWEKAAKGGCEIHGGLGLCDGPDTPSYPWGEGITGQRANFLGSGDPYDDTAMKNAGSTPVGWYDGSNHGGYQTQNSPSPYGLYDVAGNVREWCNTRYAAYPYSSSDGRESPPATPDECCRVLRGAAWDVDPIYLRVADRYGICGGGCSANCRGYTYGFRCARVN